MVVVIRGGAPATIEHPRGNVNEGDWYSHDCEYHQDHQPSQWLLRGFYK